MSFKKIVRKQVSNLFAKPPSKEGDAALDGCGQSGIRENKMEYGSRCLVFGITPNLAFALGTFLIGFKRHHGGWDGAVHVFHNGLSDADMESLRKVCRTISFQYVNEKLIKERFRNSDDVNLAVDQTVSRYSPMYFAKFEMFDLLKIHDKCIWFDVDMVVLGSFPEVWDFDEIAWRPVTKQTAAKHRRIKRWYADILKEHPVSRPNAGLVCVSRTLWDRYEIEAQNLYDIFAEIVSRKTIVSGDEMSLMILAAKNKLKCKDLSNIYNCPSASASAGQARVIHSIGKSKFWNDGAMSAAFPNWRKYYLEWVSQGGSEYVGSIDEEYIPIEPHRIVLNARSSKKRLAVMRVMQDLIPETLCPDPFQDRGSVKFYFVGIPAWIHLFVGVGTRDGEYGELSVVAMRLDVNVAGKASVHSAIEVLKSSGLRVKGFVLDLDDDQPGVLRLVNGKVLMKSIEVVLVELRDIAAHLVHNLENN